MKFAYNTDYVPPAPHLEIRLAIPDETFRMTPLVVLVDTGAGTTIVPLRYIDPLAYGWTTANTGRSQWGERQSLMCTF